MSRAHPIAEHEKLFNVIDGRIIRVEDAQHEHGEQIDAHATTIGKLTDGYNTNVRKIDKTNIFLTLLASGFGIGIGSVIMLLVWIMQMIQEILKR